MSGNSLLILVISSFNLSELYDVFGNILFFFKNIEITFLLLAKILFSHLPILYASFNDESKSNDASISDNFNVVV